MSQNVDVDELARKLRNMVILIDAGKLVPDPLMLLWSAEVCKENGAWALARDLERIARRQLPMLQRDLT